MDAVIFDMDGVLIDSEPIYMHHVLEFYRRFDIHVPYKEVVKLAGSSHEAGLEMMSAWWKEDITPSEFEKFYEANSDEEIGYSEILNPYVLYVLKRLKARGMKLAIASSSPKQAIVTMVNECGLKGYFNEIISGHDFPYSKPDPSIYLYTLQKLNVAKERCIVIEDSTYGIPAAKAAGIRVIAKHDVRFGFDQSLADYLVYDLLEAYHLIMQEGEAA